MRLTSCGSRTLPLLFLAAAVLSTEPGCASSKKGSVAEDEWVTLPPATGSNIPRRVRRSELGTAATSGNVETVSGQALMNQDRVTALPQSSGK